MIVINGYIVALSHGDEYYDAVMEKISNKPSDPIGYQYKLRADTLEWELVAVPQPSEDAEIPDEEAFAIITGEAE